MGRYAAGSGDCIKLGADGPCLETSQCRNGVLAIDEDADGFAEQCVLCDTGEVREPGPGLACGLRDGCLGHDDRRDYDHDGIADDCDDDADGDEIANIADPCPFQSVLSATTGSCVSDEDQDGITYEEDPCPWDDDPSAEAQSCELDADSDGIESRIDSCPWDPLNDRDQDGLCADVDPCPDGANSGGACGTPCASIEVATEASGWATWPASPAASSSVTGTCAATYDGTAKRDCDSTGQWRPVDSACQPAACHPAVGCLRNADCTNAIDSYCKFSQAPPLVCHGCVMADPCCLGGR